MSLPDYMVTQQSTRPIGISLLSVLHFVGGVGLVTLFAVVSSSFGDDPRLADGLAQLGIPPKLLIVGLVFLALLTIASAVGMWIGVKWGWFLGSFYYAYAIVRNVTALYTVSNVFQQMPAEAAAGMRHGIGFFLRQIRNPIADKPLDISVFFQNERA